MTFVGVTKMDPIERYKEAYRTCFNADMIDLDSIYYQPKEGTNIFLHVKRYINSLPVLKHKHLWLLGALQQVTIPFRGLNDGTRVLKKSNKNFLNSLNANRNNSRVYRRILCIWLNSLNICYRCSFFFGCLYEDIILNTKQYVVDKYVDSLFKEEDPEATYIKEYHEMMKLSEFRDEKLKIFYPINGYNEFYAAVNAKYPRYLDVYKIVTFREKIGSSNPYIFDRINKYLSSL